MAIAKGQLIESQPGLELTGGEIMCEALINEGVRLIFGYPGGAIMPFYDALHTSAELQHVLVRHEQGATHAADGYARATGQVGVVCATSGPGATNLVTGLANAFMDSVPIVAITGQVARPAIGKDSFQETDVIGVTISVTKHNILVRSAEELGDAIHEAFAIARHGRPGPVVIDVPKDVQFERAVYRPRAYRMPPPAPGDANELLLQRAAAMLDGAQKPLIMAGHGIILSGAFEALRTLAERTGTPVITTLLGLSCFPESHPLSLGMPGMHGPASVNHAINESDVILAVGMRFDDRVTGKVAEFAPNARIIHIDIEAAELRKVVKTEVPIHGDAREMLERLRKLVKPNDHIGWLARIRSWEPEAENGGDADPHEERTERAQRELAPTTDGDSCPEAQGSELRAQASAIPTPLDILQAIKRASGGQATLVTDVGQHQMWAARHYGYELPNSHFTSGGAGTMGFALPASMGVKMARPHAEVWVVAGDGGFQMNIQELMTISDLGLEIKCVVMNNGHLGMVRQWQKFFHGGRYSATPITSPNYLLLAQAYGHLARKVDHVDELQDAVEWARRTPGTIILDIAIEQERNVYPMIPSGHSIAGMIEDPDVLRNPGWDNPDWEDAE